MPPPVTLPPAPSPGRACAARGSGPPNHPRISSLWGLRPLAPTRIGRGRRGSVSVRLSLSEERAEMRALPGRARVSCGGLRPPHPRPGRARCARLGPPTHPRIFSLRGLRPLAPTRISSAPAGSEDSGPLPARGERVGARGARGARRSASRATMPAWTTTSPPPTCATASNAANASPTACATRRSTSSGDTTRRAGASATARQTEQDRTGGTDAETREAARTPRSRSDSPASRAGPARAMRS